MRKDRLAGLGVDRELRLVDQRFRGAGHLQDPAREIRQALAGVERQRVLVELLEVRHLDTGLDAVAARRASGQKLRVPAVVVVDARARRVPAGDLPDHPGKGVGRERRLRVRELDTASNERGKRRLRVVVHKPDHVALVQAVHREQQHMLRRRAILRSRRNSRRDHQSECRYGHDADGEKAFHNVIPLFERVGPTATILKVGRLALGRKMVNRSCRLAAARSTRR